MLNSLTSELDVLRPSMLESGLEVIQYNCNRRNNSLALFEFGKIYSTAESGYAEQNQLAIYLTGATASQSWNQSQKQADIYYLKGVVDNLLLYAGIKKMATVYNDKGIDIQWKKQSLCSIQQVAAKTLGDFDVKQPVFFAAINWDVWMKAMATNKIRYTEVPKHPAVQRDLAIIIDKQVTYSQVQQATDKLNIASLQEYSLFDVFESDKLGEGKKSYALNYIFQLQDRTLTDEETESLMQQLMKTYKQELQAHIRE
jgi:phenylalanyl-tRNA synthetase beta chain